MKVIRTIYEHWRYPIQNDNSGDYRPSRYKRNFKTFVPSGKGGITICRLVLDTGYEFIGVAHCNLVDNFNYRLGRAIAYGRARKELLSSYQNDLKQQFDALPFQNDTDGVLL